MNFLFMHRLFRCLIFFFSLFFLSSCLVSERAGTLPSSDSWFDGAISAKNRGSAIEISWNPASSYSQNISKFKVYLVVGEGQYRLVGTVSSQKNSYVHSGLTAGALYSYLVRAVDDAGNEDVNAKIVTNVAYQGITDVEVTGKTTATVYLPGGGGSFDEVRIYAEPMTGEGRKLVGSTNGNASSLAITGLRSGATYKFYANVFSSAFQGEDGNLIYITRRTDSEGFDGNNYKYRGFALVAGYGSAPGAATDPADPLRIPKTRLIRLTWLPFAGASATTKYRVVRTLAGGDLNMATTALCSSSSTVSCKVCEVTGSGLQTCTDSNVAAPPVTYEYSVSLVISRGDDSWVEELPLSEAAGSASDYSMRVKAQVPPDNMVLVQRDSVNYETCQFMVRSSDPLKKQRCTYSGLGARPTNTGPGKPSLNLESGYYDFGYNLFVDRWETGCNWTSANSGGMCGAGGTSGDCMGFSTGSTFMDPSASLGVDGNVFYQVGQFEIPSNGIRTTSRCYLKVAGSWVSASNLLTGSYSNAQRASVLTVDPSANGGYRPPLGDIHQVSAVAACTAQTTPYGNKRLIRRREQIASNAMPTIQGEPNWMTPLQASRISADSDGHASGNYQCASDNLKYGLTVGDPNRIDAISGTSASNILTVLRNTSMDKQANVYTFGGARYGMSVPFLGSLITSKCVSRYGVQDSFGSFDETSVDQIGPSANVAANTTVGASVSSYDDGATDFAGFVFNGTQGLRSLEPTPGANSSVYYSNGSCYYDGTSTACLAQNYFSVPLGLPLANSDDGGNAISMGDLNTRLGYGLLRNRFVFHIRNYLLGIASGGRFDTTTGATRFSFETRSYNVLAFYSTPRCVQSPE